MKGLYRVLVSLVAASVFLLMNSPTLVALAWGDWNTAPQWSDPTWETAPQWNDSTWKTAPEWKTPPKWKTPPEWQDPSWKNQPQWNDPTWKTKPEWNNDGQKDSTNPGGTNPQLPDGSNPNMQPPGPSNNSDNQKPSNDNENPAPGQNTTSPTDEPFGTLKKPEPYDALKYTAKDVLGETANFTIQVTRQGTAEWRDFRNFNTKMIYSGFKTFAKGDPTLDGIYNVKDIYTNGKNIYDQYKTFDTLNDVRNLKNAGDLLTAAEVYGDLAAAGKTLTPANAIVSSLLLPFTVKDTVDNINKLNNPKNATEKTDAAWDLVENSGEMITGLAPLVALIPGAQPIAAGMVVVGTALTLVSLGSKLYRNRTKIWNDVTKKAGKIKDKVSGIWNSVFG